MLQYRKRLPRNERCDSSLVTTQVLVMKHLKYILFRLKILICPMIGIVGWNNPTLSWASLLLGLHTAPSVFRQSESKPRRTTRRQSDYVGCSEACTPQAWYGWYCRPAGRIRINGFGLSSGMIGHLYHGFMTSTRKILRRRSPRTYRKTPGIAS